MFSLPTLKSKLINKILFTFLIEIRIDSIKPIYLATKGRSYFLLKKSRTLRKRRAETRKFEINVSVLNRDEEESSSSNRIIIELRESAAKNDEMKEDEEKSNF